MEIWQRTVLWQDNRQIFSILLRTDTKTRSWTTAFNAETAVSAASGNKQWLIIFRLVSRYLTLYYHVGSWEDSTIRPTTLQFLFSVECTLMKRNLLMLYTSIAVFFQKIVKIWHTAPFNHIQIYYNSSPHLSVCPDTFIHIFHNHTHHLHEHTQTHITVITSYYELEPCAGQHVLQPR